MFARVIVVFSQQCLTDTCRSAISNLSTLYRSLNGMTPYLVADLQRLSDMPSRRRLRSSVTHQCAAVGDRTFATAGAWLWNSLPTDIVACETLPLFRRGIKTQSYPDILL